MISAYKGPTISLEMQWKGQTFPKAFLGKLTISSIDNQGYLFFKPGGQLGYHKTSTNMLLLMPNKKNCVSCNSADPMPNTRHPKKKIMRLFCKKLF